MPEYHVGVGLLGTIYAGTLEPRNKLKWRNKSDVTEEALSAVAQYLLFEGKEFRFKCGTKWHVLRVEDIEAEGEG